MLRRVLFLPATALALSMAFGQTPAGQGQPQSQPQTQATPADQVQPSAASQTDQKGKPGDPNVFVMKAPAPPPNQPQFVPPLRAVDLEKRPRLSETTKNHLIQLMDAEFAHVRKFFPLGDKSLVIDAQGRVTPNDAALFQQIQTRGAAAKVGDKVQITNIVFHEKTVYVEINGGPKKKTKWYQHISVGVGGSGGSTTPIDGNEAQPTGAAFTLQFNKPLPEMNNDDLKKLLSPVLDFSSKSASEAYTETLPPKVRDAIKNHEVLVGMNREMVIMAKDRPQQKVREKDGQGKDYEEWIYGHAPQDVVFIRLVGDEVTQVKTMKVGGQTVLKTEKEVDVKDGVASLASLKAATSPQEAAQEQQEEQQPAKRPTLRKEGEVDPNTEILRAPNGQTQAPQPPHPRDEPEWGTGSKPGGQQAPPPDPQKPPPY
jgi:hypothetical protein